MTTFERVCKDAAETAKKFGRSNYVFEDVLVGSMSRSKRPSRTPCWSCSFNIPRMPKGEVWCIEDDGNKYRMF